MISYLRNTNIMLLQRMDDKVQDLKLIETIKANDSYRNKIHSNQEFYEKERSELLNTKEIDTKTTKNIQYREHSKEYCRIKMKEYCQRKKANAVSA